MALVNTCTGRALAPAEDLARGVRPGDVLLEPTAGNANLVDRFYGKIHTPVQATPEADALAKRTWFSSCAAT